VHLFERDCTVQRRNQKVVERAPAVFLTASQREELCAAALAVGRAAHYHNAGTVEFLQDADSGRFYFIEVNPRIQVEHTVTEETTDVDLVRSQIMIAAGATLAAYATGLIPWDRAQGPFASLSRKLGDQVQALLAQRFKGSPAGVQTASVRQLRTTAAPAIAVEVSSVTVEDRAQLDHMAPGVADAIARGAAAFRPSYVVPVNPGERP